MNDAIKMDAGKKKLGQRIEFLVSISIPTSIFQVGGDTLQLQMLMKHVFRHFIPVLMSLNVVIIVLVLWRVPYTEIDWRAYMQQIEVYESGVRNYYKIEGDTGPIVYPAGHVYLFEFLRNLSDAGKSILTAQVIFGFFYSLTLLIVFRNGKLAGVPVWLLSLSILSRRTISLFVLRLFNDGPCVLLSHVCVYLLMRRKWALACLFLSLAVSVKMNALLYAPGVLFILWRHLGRVRALQLIVCVCGSVQLVLGWPFLSTYPVAYVHKAFELSRVFHHKWSANFQFLSESVFQSPGFGLVLLALTVGTYVFFYKFIWVKAPHNILFIMYSSNFIGVVFARTIHYQFYSWYSFSLPALVYYATWFPRWPRLDWVGRIGVLGGIEFCYNYPFGSGDNPATPFSSLLLQILHVILLVGLVRARLTFKQS